MPRMQRAGFYATVISLIMLMAGCALWPILPQATLAPTPAAIPVYNTAPITLANAYQISEFRRIDPQDYTPVAAITFNRSITRLMSVHLSGALRHIELSTGALISFDVSPVSMRTTTFDSSGDLLATSYGLTKEKPQAVRHSSTRTIRIWDIATGIVRKALTSTLSSSVAMSPDGKWAIATGSSALDVINIDKGEFTSLILNTSMYGIEAVTFDTEGRYVAYADQQGWVAIEQLIDGRLENVNDLGTPGLDRNRFPEWPLEWRPAAIAFDPTRQWLALVASGYLSILDIAHGPPPLLRPNGFPALTHLFIKTGELSGQSAALAFDQSGHLLAVGTINGWQMWDVANKRKLIENTDAPVYALTFSPDGRLFAYGDANGVIHVWGVRK